MTRFLKIFALGLLPLLPVSCKFLQKHPKVKEEQKVTPPLYLGSVHQVYPKDGYAVLRIIGPMPSAGSTLITHPADGTNTRIGNLCVTADKPTSNGFITAQVRSGTVVRGDRVFVYRDLTPAIEDQANADETEQVLTDLAPDLPSSTPVADTPQPAVTPAATAPATLDDGTPMPATQPQPKPSSPINSGSPGKAPSYLDKIPDDVNGWD